MRVSLLLCVLLTCAASKRLYEVSCPDCRQSYQLHPTQEITTGGRMTTNGVIQDVSLSFKCPKKHKFTATAERLIPTPPKAKEIQ